MKRKALSMLLLGSISLGLALGLASCGEDVEPETSSATQEVTSTEKETTTTKDTTTTVEPEETTTEASEVTTTVEPTETTTVEPEATTTVEPVETTTVEPEETTTVEPEITTTVEPEETTTEDVPKEVSIHDMTDAEIEKEYEYFKKCYLLEENNTSAFTYYYSMYNQTDTVTTGTSEDLDDHYFSSYSENRGYDPSSCYYAVSHNSGEDQYGSHDYGNYEVDIKEEDKEYQYDQISDAPLTYNKYQLSDGHIDYVGKDDASDVASELYLRNKNGEIITFDEMMASTDGSNDESLLSYISYIDESFDSIFNIPEYEITSVTSDLIFGTDDDGLHYFIVTSNYYASMKTKTSATDSLLAVTESEFHEVSETKIYYSESKFFMESESRLEMVGGNDDASFSYNSIYTNTADITLSFNEDSMPSIPEEYNAVEWTEGCVYLNSSEGDFFKQLLGTIDEEITDFDTDEAFTYGTLYLDKEMTIPLEGNPVAKTYHQTYYVSPKARDLDKTYCIVSFHGRTSEDGSYSTQEGDYCYLKNKAFTVDEEGIMSLPYYTGMNGKTYSVDYFIIYETNDPEYLTTLSTQRDITIEGSSFSASHDYYYSVSIYGTLVS